MSRKINLSPFFGDGDDYIEGGSGSDSFSLFASSELRSAA